MDPAAAGPSAGARDRPYRIFGRPFISTIPLPELASTPCTDEQDAWRVASSVRIDAWCERWDVLWREPSGEPWAVAGRTSAGYVLRLGGIADIHVTTRTLAVAPRGYADPAVFRHVLLDSAVPLALTASGELVLHASAVARPGRAAFAFCAPSGTGKSTVAAALAAHGYDALSDDAVVITVGAPVHVTPSYPGLRLWPDSASALGLDMSRGSSGGAKQRFARHRPDESRPRCLAAIAVLQRGTCFRVSELSRRDAAIEIIRHAFRIELRDPSVLERQLAAAAAIADVVPVLRVSVPEDLAQLTSTAARVADTLRRLE